MSLSKPGRSADALALVLRYARPRVRSTREAAAYLHRRGVSARAASQAIRQAQSMGVLDDLACARLWAGQWARQGYALSTIRQRLLERGLNERVAGEAADWIASVESDQARARELLAARVGRGQTQRAQLARTLASKGFDPELIDQLLAPSVDAEP